MTRQDAGNHDHTGPPKIIPSNTAAVTAQKTKKPRAARRHATTPPIGANNASRTPSGKGISALPLVVG